MSDNVGVSGMSDSTISSGATEANETETLIVVSKVKKLVRSLGGLNTSQCCVDALTQVIIQKVKAGVSTAQQAGRKTLMGRDIQ